MKSVVDVAPQVRHCEIIDSAWKTRDRDYVRSILRSAVPTTPDGCVLILARVMLQILETRPLTRFRPVVSVDPVRPSLWRAAVLESSPEDAAAFAEISDEMALEAANLARWAVGLPQQVSIFPLVLVTDEDVLEDEERSS